MNEAEKRLVDEWRAEKIASGEVEYWALNDEQALREIARARAEKEKQEAIEKCHQQFLNQLKERCGYEPTESQIAAKKILGDRFLGIEEVARHYYPDFRVSHIAALWDVPIPQEALERGKETHLLVAGFPLDVLDIRRRYARLFNAGNIYNDEWYRLWSYSRAKMALGWHWIPIIKASDFGYYNGVGFVKQDKPFKVVDVVYSVILYYLASGIKLYKDHYVWCSDLDNAKGYGVCGKFDDEGLRIARFQRYWMLGRAGEV